jgi:hypothetical protein
MGMCYDVTYGKTLCGYSHDSSGICYLYDELHHALHQGLVAFGRRTPHLLAQGLQGLHDPVAADMAAPRVGVPTVCKPRCVPHCRLLLHPQGYHVLGVSGTLAAELRLEPLCVTMVLESCFSGVTMVLQRFDSGISIVSQWCYSGVSAGSTCSIYISLQLCKMNDARASHINAVTSSLVLPARICSLCCWCLVFVLAFVLVLMLVLVCYSW